MPVRNAGSGEILEMSDNEESKKPRLEDFLHSFEEKIRQVNLTYKDSKIQFENDMKSFKEQDILIEEEMIEKQINEGGGLAAVRNVL